MAVFSSPRINASWLAACRLLPGTGRSYRLFARPQRLPPLGDLHSGVKAPSLLLRFLPSTLVVPVRPFGSTTASRFAPVAAGSLPVARCTSTTRFGLPRLRSPLPSRIFNSLGIKAFTRLCCLPVHLTNPPDFLSLPAARPNQSGAADHRSRSATFPSACCSSNLLEPFSLCSRCAFPSTLLSANWRLFLSLYLICFESVTVSRRCKSCG